MSDMNTHQKYQTINHHHFDFRYPTGGILEYPESALMLVQCADGRWYVQQEFGAQYSGFEGVVRSDEDVESVPTFYVHVEDAAKAAFALIKQVYPTTPDECLLEFLDD
jgi:hypothetical protein